MVIIFLFSFCGNLLFGQNINRPNIKGPSGTNVNTFTGNLFYQRKDLGLPGVGTSLEVIFSYNTSRDSINNGYGFGWDFNYGMQYQVSGDSIIFTSSDGRDEVYTLNGNVYDKPIGVFNTITFNNNTLEITDKYGMKYLFEDNAHKKLTKIIDRNNNTIQLTYANGYPSVISNSSGNQIQLVWSNNLLTSISDGSRVVNYSYANEYLTTVSFPLGYTEEYQYNIFGKMSILKDRDNYPVSIDYNEGKVTQLQSCLGKENIIYRELDTYHSINASSGNQLTKFTFDTLGNNIQLTNPAGSKYSFEYDANKNLIKEIDSKSQSMTYSYDANGNMISKSNALGNTRSYSYTTFSLRSSITNERGHLTNYSYDNNGNLTTVEYPDGSSRSYTYFANGLLQSETDGNNNSTTYVYDDFGNVIQINFPIGSINLIYNSIGNLIQKIDQNSYTTNYTYDEYNRLLSITDHLNNSASFTYDGRGNIVSETDVNGNTKIYTYDGLGRLSSVTLPNQYPTLYKYDLKGNQIEIIDANGNKNISIYNDQNLTTEFIDGIGNRTKYKYDQNGNLILVISPNGNEISYTYDALNRVTQIAYPENTDEFQYDQNGNVIIAYNNDITYNYSYDELNRLENLNIVTWNKSIQYQYDNNGNRISMTDPDNGMTSYTYNINNQLESITDPFNSTSSFIYDFANRLIEQTNGNNSKTYYNYNELDYLLSLNNLKSNGDTISSFVYTYDDFGNRLSKTKIGNIKDEYFYDDNYRLKNVEYGDGDFERFGFDNTANRTYLVNNQDSINYNYNETDQLMSVGSQTFHYDLNGNTVNQLSNSTNIINVFDSQNRLITMNTQSSISNFKYDPFGKRIEVNIDSDSTLKFVYDDNNILQELNETNGRTKQYTTALELDSWLSFQSAGQNYYFHKDAINSVNNITNQNQLVENNYEYDAYGSIKNKVESVNNRIQYSGREFDNDHYYYYRTRFYNPNIGRFISKDNFPGIVNIPFSLNRYNYVNSNPINYNDPNGEFAPIIGIGVVATIAGIIGVITEVIDGITIGKNTTDRFKENAELRKKRQEALDRGDDITAAILLAEIKRNSIKGAGATLIDGVGLNNKNIAKGLGIPDIIPEIIKPKSPKTGGSGNGGSGNGGSGNGGSGNGGSGGGQGGVGGGGSTTTTTISIDRLHAVDPNDIIGPLGFDSLQWMSVNDEFGFTIRFENDPDFATGPAQIVKINCPIDDKMNLSSVRLGTFGFGDFVFNPPPNSSFYADRLDVTDSLGVFVDITAGIDINNKEVFWIFESIDPVTGLAPLEGDVGFLPVNDTTVTIYTDTITQKGEGFVTFTILPKSSDITGDTISEQAIIIFDENEEIPTNIWTNVIDAFPPTTQVDTTYTLVDDDLTIGIEWSGVDDPLGVGIDFYDLYVSVDEGTFQLVEENIDTTYFEYVGFIGLSYSFYTRGTDYVGNLEDQKFTANNEILLGNLDSIDIIQPIADIILCESDSMAIEWEVFGQVEGIDIYLSSDGGVTFPITIGNNIDKNQSPLKYSLEGLGGNGNNYIIQLKDTLTDGFTAQSGAFTIISSDSCSTDCPNDLTLSTAPIITITNSTCPQGQTIPSGGSFAAPSGCPTGSIIQYSIDAGATWSETIPIYDQTSPMTVLTRCNCIVDNSVYSLTATVTTMPDSCGLVCPNGLAESTAPLIIVTNSTCPQGQTTPSGGSFAAPTGCPTGSIIQYSTDVGSTWSNVIPTYNQTTSMAVMTRCNCIADTTISSNSVEVISNPGTCGVTGNCMTTTNLALNKPTSQSTVLTAGGITGAGYKAVDGNTNGTFFISPTSSSSVSATTNENEAWWEVDLGDIYNINEVKLWNRTDGVDKTNDCYLIISNTPFTSGNLSDALNQATYSILNPGLLDSPTVNIPNATGRYVRVQLSGTGYLTLAEVEVLGCSINGSNCATTTNLALNKLAIQSTTLTAGGITGAGYKAVDGNTNGTFFITPDTLSSVSATTNENEAWWEVDLGDIYNINEIKLWNRTDGVDKTNDCYLIISNTPFTSGNLFDALNQATYSILNPELLASPTVNIPDTTGRYVRVQLSGTGYLTLAEVEVLGCSISGSNCSEPLLVVDNNPVFEGNYYAQNNIISEGVIYPNTIVEFRAGTDVLLEPGFHAKQGSDFRAYISACSSSLIQAINENSITDQTNKRINKSELQLEVKPTNTMMDVTIIPNPFTHNTTIQFTVSEDKELDIEIYDVNGKLIKTLARNKHYESGIHNVMYDGSNTQSGVYLLLIKTKKTQVYRKMILMK